MRVALGKVFQRRDRQTAVLFNDPTKAAEKAEAKDKR